MSFAIFLQCCLATAMLRGATQQRNVEAFVVRRAFVVAISSGRFLHLSPPLRFVTQPDASKADTGVGLGGTGFRGLGVVGGLLKC